MRSTNPQHELARVQFNEAAEELFESSMERYQKAAQLDNLANLARELFASVIKMRYGISFARCSNLLRALGKELNMHVEVRSYQK